MSLDGGGLARVSSTGSYNNVPRLVAEGRSPRLGDARGGWLPGRGRRPGRERCPDDHLRGEQREPVMGARRPLSRLLLHARRHAHLFLADRTARRRNIDPRAGDDTLACLVAAAGLSRRIALRKAVGMRTSSTWRIALALLLVLPLAGACKKKGPRRARPVRAARAWARRASGERLEPRAQPKGCARGTGILKDVHFAYDSDDPRRRRP